jgi:isoquinoline 1-oxidoreductase beta subunit
MAISRRNVLIAGGVIGGGLVVGFSVLRDEKTPPYPNGIPRALQPNAFLQVTPDSRIVLQIHKTEMGQGILTGLTTIVAEELNMPPTRVQTEFSGVHPDYLNPQFDLQITNASSSMITCYLPVREAAAAVRAMLLQAAADAWGVGIDSVELRDARVIELRGDREAAVGELVAIARSLPVPEAVALKPRAEFQYIGRFQDRLDSLQKVNGTAMYGMDTQVPDALTAVVVRCPQFGGCLEEFDASAAKNAVGVVDVFEIDSGVAVVANHYWHARRAADLLKISWTTNAATQDSSETIGHEQTKLLDARDAEDEPFAGENILTAEYTAPFQAHACMEPMNATVAIGADRVDVWVSTQAAGIMQSGVAQALGVPAEQVTVHSTFAGGGFGRRVYPDAGIEAALIAKRAGRPVKVIWSREDDIRHDMYRPSVMCRMSAAIDGESVERWRYRICTPSLHATLIPGIRARLFPAWLPDFVFNQIVAQAARDDEENIEGAFDSAYQLGEMDAEQVMWKPGIPVSFWRSVGHSFNGFFMEGFIDEMAQQAGADVVEFRRQHLEAGSRPRKVLDYLVEVADWGNTKPGVYQGIAVDAIKGAVCGQVADVQVEGDQIRVKRVVCVVDLGLIINPDIAKTQIESCIVWGLTAALKSEVTIADRAVVQSNFHDFPMLRMDETPIMEVFLIESGDHPVGVGECAVAPVAPAVANAVFQATGKRLRSLPLRL